MHNLRNKVNESFRGRQENGNRRNDNDEDHGNGHKIYTDKDGEYADFEDVKGPMAEEAADNTTDARTVVEEQVTDAEFEEIS